jgi:hypothetical protein
VGHWPSTCVGVCREISKPTRHGKFSNFPHKRQRGGGGGGPKERSTHHRRHHHPYGSRRSNKHTHTEVRSLCISKERLFFAGVSVRTLLFERAQERTDTACASDRLALPAASPVLSAYTSAVLRAAENNARAHCCTPLWPVVVFGRLTGKWLIIADVHDD